MRLIIVRHAKSSWKHTALDDHDRPLSGRGRRASKSIGQWLAAYGYRPESVISSSSARTRDTWARIEKFFPGKIDTSFDFRLYHCSSSAILEILAEANGSPILVVGHNPGIAHFAARMVGTPPPHRDFWRYPTGSTLVCDLPFESWPEVEFGHGRVVDFVVPRDLE